MRAIAVFDFDGTITKKDTFLEFIKFAKGRFAFYCGFLLYSPLLIAYKLGLYPNWKIKQKIFSYFFKGMKHNDFKNLGIEFINEIETFSRTEIINKIQWHQSQGHEIYIVSASIEEWVKPWCNSKNINKILCTQIGKNDNDELTGNFSTPNCYGAEKVNRFLVKEPDRKNYFLYAYGDSKGDKEMFNLADEWHLI